MFFYALTSAGPRWWCWNPSIKGDGFNVSEGSSRRKSIRKPGLIVFGIKSFCHLKTLEKCFEKFILYYFNGAQKNERFGFAGKKPVPEQRLTSS